MAKIEEKLKIIRDTPTKYHFKSKDDQLVDIEYKDERLFVSLFKWGTETSLQIDLDSVYSTQHNFLETENRIEIENPDFLLRVYPIDIRSTGDLYGDADNDIQCHDGGLRFELVLKKKRPAMDNFFILPITSRNLRFSKQPFLTPEDIAIGTSCPLNVEGSYAVYHASKKNNQYMTGKAFHLFRPIAEDALGNKAWCSINIDKYIDPTSLTVTIPQQFLDEATYPITIDPDFGYTTIGAGSVAIASTAQPFRRGSAWTMPAGGGYAIYIKARLLSSTTDTVDCKAFINEKDSGGVGTHGLIAGPVENLACVAAEHWEQFDLSGEALTGGVDYIINLLGDPDDVTNKHFYKIKEDIDSAVDSYRDEGETYCSETNPWVGPTVETTIDYTAYVNYSETPPPVEGGGLRMVLGLKGHMGYDLKTRGGKARRRMG